MHKPVICPWNIESYYDVLVLLNRSLNLISVALTKTWNYIDVSIVRSVELRPKALLVSFAFSQGVVKPIVEMSSVARTEPFS